MATKLKQTLAAVSLSKDLANYGYANNLPSALLSAVQIWIANPTVEPTTNLNGKEEKTKEAKVIDAKVTDNTPPEFNPTKMLADAKTMAKGDNNILALIAQSEISLNGKMKKITEEKTRGAYGGAIYTSRTVSSYSTYTFSVNFRGGYYARIVLDGDRDTDLDFYVYDSYGNLIGSDTDGTDTANFGWTPRYTQEYTFKVVNHGSVYNTFSIITN